MVADFVVVAIFNGKILEPRNQRLLDNNEVLADGVRGLFTIEDIFFLFRMLNDEKRKRKICRFRYVYAFDHNSL